jgi:ABC-type nitrate/sulfonate/bicarbonate transport system permease component
MAGGSDSRAGAARDRAASAGLALLGAILVFGLWAAASAWVGETRLPSPVTVAISFFSTITSSPEIKLQGGGSDGFLPHVLATAWHFLLGTLSGVALAGFGLVLAARFPLFAQALDPFVSILRSIPPLALAPFLILWFGTATIGQASLVAFYVFVMIYPPGVAAVARVEPALIGFASTLGASRTVKAREIILPAIVPAIAGPLQVAVSWSWGLVVVGELLGARQGIGKLLAGFVPITATDLTMAGIMWILLMAVASEAVLTFLLRRATRWMP